MSGLKDYDIMNIEAMDDERLEKSESGRIQVTRVYIKAEADKVIAEKDKEIAELEERIADGDKDFEMANHQNEWLLKIVRHQKYKRCLAMRNMCRYAQYSYSYLMAYEGCKICTNDIDFRKYDKKYHFYLRWRKRWMELAERFK